jgi:hypothetical protein
LCLPAADDLLNDRVNAWETADTPKDDNASKDDDASANGKTAGENFYFGGEDESPPEPKRKEFRLKNRAFEIGFGRTSFDFANDFIATKDFFNDNVLIRLLEDGNIFKNTGEINIDRFFDGFPLDFGLDMDPFFFNINVKDKWGFGLNVNLNVSGNIMLPETLLKIKLAKNEKIGIGAAVFLDVGIPVFFHAKEVKIKFRPSVYLPLAYSVPSVKYTYKPVNPDTGMSGILMSADFDVKVYTPVSIEPLMNGDVDPMEMLQSLLDNWKDVFGYDFKLGAEYPIHEKFDIGVDMVNIPIIPSKLNHYMQMKGNAWVDTSKIDIAGIIDGDLSSLEQGETWDYSIDEDENGEFMYHKSGSSGNIFRPFKMLLYGNYRPFESRKLTLIPVLGFSINPLYLNKGAFEGGLGIRFDFGNMFIVTLGIHYMDRKWKNSIDFTLFNLRVIQLDLGLVFQSQDFVESWRGAGFGVNVGLKFGW